MVFHIWTYIMKATCVQVMLISENIFIAEMETMEYIRMKTVMNVYIHKSESF